MDRAESREIAAKVAYRMVFAAADAELSDEQRLVNMKMARVLSAYGAMLLNDTEAVRAQALSAWDEFVTDGKWFNNDFRAWLNRNFLCEKSLQGEGVNAG